VFFSALIYHDEPEISAFFGNLKQLYLPKDSQDVAVYENFLNATLFFCGSISIKSNALRALFITIFQPVLLNTKVSKQLLPNGTYRKQLQLYIPDFCFNTFIMLVPSVSQPLK
jgi:hypothetical protein